MTGKPKKILSVLTGVVIAIFLVIALIALIVTVVYRTRGEDAEILGYQFRIVVSGSMEPEIKVNSLVVIDTVGSEGEISDELKVGDIVTFYDYDTPNADDVIVTHRIIEIEETSDGARTFTLQGDAPEATDTQRITEDEIIGKVIWWSYPLGAVLTFLRSSAGIVVCLILPAALIMIYEVFRIVRLVREGKNEQKRENDAARDEEIESLRRELAELKKEKEKKDA